MTRKVLVPVLPTERFYDAVVAAASLVAAEKGGLIVFLFTDLRPPALAYEDDAGGRPDLASLEDDVDEDHDAAALEQWRLRQVEALDEARSLLRERGIDGRNVEYAFADYAVPRAEAIAEEAAAGGYDAVILPSGFLHSGSTNVEEEPPDEISQKLRELDEVRLYVV